MEGEFEDRGAILVQVAYGWREVSALLRSKK
jgi:hypothetical protein